MCLSFDISLSFNFFVLICDLVCACPLGSGGGVYVPLQPWARSGAGGQLKLCLHEWDSAAFRITLLGCSVCTQRVHLGD